MAWQYIQELIAEIDDSEEPHRKKMPREKMDILNAWVDMDASIITYPFDILKLDLRKSRGRIVFKDKRSISSETIQASIAPFRFKHPENSGSLIGLAAAEGTLSFKRLSISGFNEFDLAMNIQG